MIDPVIADLRRFLDRCDKEDKIDEAIESVMEPVDAAIKHIKWCNWERCAIHLRDALAQADYFRDHWKG